MTIFGACARAHTARHLQGIAGKLRQISEWCKKAEPSRRTWARDAAEQRRVGAGTYLAEKVFKVVWGRRDAWPGMVGSLRRYKELVVVDG